mgnify:FL=1
MLNNIKKQTKYILLLTIVLASSFSLAIAPFIVSEKVDADVKTIQEQSDSYLYYRAFSVCFAEDATQKNPTLDDINSGNWFDTRAGLSTEISMGYLGSTEEGKYGVDVCENPEFVNKALALWGYTDKVTAWCKDLMQYANGQREGGNKDCVDGEGSYKTDGGNRKDSFQRAIHDRIYNGQPPRLSPAANYHLNLSSFTSSCRAKQIAKFDTATDSQKTMDQGNYGYKVKIVGENNKVEEWIFQKDPASGNPTKSDEVSVYDTGNGSKDRTTCQQIAQYISDNAEGTAEYNRENNITPIPPPAPGVGGGDPSADPATEPASSCQIDGIGWVICPVIAFLSKIVDAAYSAVSAMLLVQPIGGNATVYEAWAIVRNLANVAFVAAFLIIIFSQVSSIGITNYGIKKMLPKLIIAAIFVNVSYWICVIAVDLSNIIGSSINDIFKNLGTQVSGGESTGGWSGAGAWSETSNAILGGIGLSVIALYVGLSAFAPALIIALMAIITVFAVLTIRQGLILLLVIISPLAFVAFLLPNTESLFKKWRSLFQTLLLMFPIIALMFGASKLASVVITESASQLDNQEGLQISMQAMGALVAIVPLALTPIVMKAAGGLLGNIGGMINNPNKGPFDRAKKGAQSFADEQKSQRGIRALDPNKTSLFGRKRAINRRSRIDTRRAGREQQMKDLKDDEMLKRAASTDNNFAETVAGAGAGAYRAAAQAQLNKKDKEKVENEALVLRASVSPDQLIASAQAALATAVTLAGSSTGQAKEEAIIQARSAQSILTSTGAAGLEALRTQLETTEPADEKVRTELKSDLASDPSLKGKDAGIAKWSTTANTTTFKDVNSSADTWSGLSDEQIAGQTSKAIAAGKTSTGKDAATGAIFSGIDKATSLRILTNDRLTATMGKEAKDALSK